MSDRRRKSVLAAALVALVAGALAIALAAGPEESPVASGTGAARPTAEERGGLVDGREKVLVRLREHAEHRLAAEEARQTRRVVGDPADETDARAQEVVRFAADEQAAKPIARRFFSAFSAYELAQLSPAREREVRATTTPAFARELLAARSPRVPSGAAAPAPARIVELDFVPGESRGGRLLSLELVATVDRGGEHTPLAIALRRADGGWLVEALGR